MLRLLGPVRSGQRRDDIVTLGMRICARRIAVLLATRDTGVAALRAKSATQSHAPFEQRSGNFTPPAR